MLHFFYLIASQALKILYKLNNFLLHIDIKIKQRLVAHKI